MRQEDLAAVLGVQKATVSNYETDRVGASDNVKIKIAKFFDISVDYLLGLVDEPVPYYRPEIFMKIPQGIRSNERELLAEFVEFIDNKRKD